LIGIEGAQRVSPWSIGPTRTEPIKNSKTWEEKIQKMKPEEFQAKLPGVHFVMFTPFKDENVFEVDHDAIRSNLRYLLNAGAQIVIATGSGGEFSSLTDEERVEVWKTVASEAKGKALLIAGNGHSSTKQTIELTKEAERIGFEGFMTITPYYLYPDDEGMYQHYKMVAESTSLGIMLYNSPKYAKSNMPLSVLDRLAQIPNIVAIKETAYDMNQVYWMIRVMEKYKKPVICGMGEHWYSWCGLFDGCVGFISIIGNWCPDIALELYDAVQKRDLPAVDRIRRGLDPLRRMFIRIQETRYHSRLAASKEPMDMIEGLRCGRVRPPLTGLTNEEGAELREILKNMGRRLKA